MVTATKQLEDREEFLSGADQGAPQLPRSVPSRAAAPQAPQLPPSERDFRVYERLVLSGVSSREAAGDFGISQTRVLQIQRRVAEWLAECFPACASPSPLAQVRQAADLAKRRLDHLYAEAMECYRMSQGERRTTRVTASGDTIVTSCDSPGDVRYIRLASAIVTQTLGMSLHVSRALGLDRFIEAQDRAVAALDIQTLAESARAAAEEEEGERLPAPDGESPGQRPPLRDCSPNAGQSALIDEGCAESRGASPVGEDAYSEMEQRRREFLAALKDDTAPVHAPFTDAGGMLLDASQPVRIVADDCAPVLQLKLNGHEPGAALSATSVAEDDSAAARKRHDRRARQRELDRLRRRAK